MLIIVKNNIFKLINLKYNTKNVLKQLIVIPIALQVTIVDKQFICFLFK